MGLDKRKLNKVEHPLQGFLDTPVKVEGSVELSIRADAGDRQVTVMINFLVVDITLAYNAILGRVGLNLLKAVVSTPHLKMKFSTKNGVGECRVDQEASRKCYATTLWGKGKAGEALLIEDLRDDTNYQRGELTEELIQVEAKEGDSTRQFQAERTWTLYVDGASNSAGSGAGIILVSPEGFKIECAIQFNFDAFNNEVNGDYKAKEQRMAKYLKTMREKATTFKEFEVKHVPWAENASVDVLSQLATFDFTALGRSVYFEVLPQLSTEEPYEVLSVGEHGPSWMDAIIEYLKEGTLPKDRDEARKSQAYSDGLHCYGNRSLLLKKIGLRYSHSSYSVHVTMIMFRPCYNDPALAKLQRCKLSLGNFDRVGIGGIFRDHMRDAIQFVSKRLDVSSLYLFSIEWKISRL
ncbi:uncharacterized protein LOC122086230 [Macadamia integrifolia]|uniref:uncharacterized protein LOC122086230 n=1 Tax=Macadamia integrifolia TaxID=60698 RepID=UPI001C4FFCF0|nr:uncharacterized protein LOC122086230 [Macadamia integrifolia]